VKPESQANIDIRDILKKIAAELLASYIFQYM